MLPITPSDGLKKVVYSDSWECMLLQLQKSLTFQCQTSARKNETCRCMRGSLGRTVNSKKREWEGACRTIWLETGHPCMLLFVLVFLVFCCSNDAVSVRCEMVWKRTKLWNIGFHLPSLWSIQDSVHWCSHYIHGPQVLWGILCSTKISYIIYMANMSS